MTAPQNKWLLLLSSIIFGLFGYFAIANPALTILQLVLYVGVLQLVLGCYYLYQYFKNKPENGTYMLVSAIFSIIFGLAVIFSKYFGVFLVATLPYMIGIWAICTGGIEIYKSKTLATETKKPWVFILCGILQIIYGLFMLFSPYLMLLETQVVVGFYFIFFAVVQFVYFIMSFFKKDE